MAMPRSVRVIDTMIGFRSGHNIPRIAALPDRADAGNPIGYMFREIPADRPAGVSDEAAVEETVAKMDAHGIEIGLVNLSGDAAKMALRRHPDRFA
ncbi:MAG TPA: hypothetical protein VF834_22980, partial [Streptosporangiaceae bacterium]